MSEPGKYYHSVTLDKQKCVGCTACLKRCPTEAIRVHGGKAHIIDQRCIDCGECIRTCPHHAKVATTNPLATINTFKYKIALPAPALYGQFKNLPNVGSVTRGLHMMGFDYVYDVARGADIATVAVRELLKDPNCPRPLISSSCPAVVRLIQTRFPELIDNIADVKSPMEIAAIEARREFCERSGANPADVGCFFITPCAAKMTAIRNPIGHGESAVNGAISFLEVYGLLSSQVKKSVAMPQTPDEEMRLRATSYGLGWARAGGEATAANIDNALAVDGIEHVAKVLEQIENNRLLDLVFFEGQSCIGGCVGGPLVFENGFISRNRIRLLTRSMREQRPEASIKPEDYARIEPNVHLDRPIQPIKVLQLDDNLQVALAKMDQIEAIRQRMPGLDCGSCGSPSCQALAEDVVMGFASELDCLLVLKERVRELAGQMVNLSENTRR